MNTNVQKRALEAILAEKSNTEAVKEPISTRNFADMAVGLLSMEIGVANLIRGRVKKMHAQVALGKIENGTYAQCSVCDEEIKEKRLVAVPEAIFCIACQEKVDQGESIF